MKKKVAKKPTKKTGCNCLETSKEQLEKVGVVVTRYPQINFATGKMSLPPPSLVVHKPDGWKRKLPTLYCSYCPFCGKKY